MQLQELIDNLSNVKSVDGNINVDIKGIVIDIDEVEKGSLFVCLDRDAQTGAELVFQAISRGAIAVLMDEAIEVSGDITFIKSSFLRKSFSQIIDKISANQVEYIVAVTGTNGKSSTVDFCQQIWRSMGYKAASMGTLGIVSSVGVKEWSCTSPDVMTMHSELSNLHKQGITHLAFEASSHGLHQERAKGVNVKAGAFTNLTREHLDYHETEDQYFDAKLTLFEELMAEGGTAVLNSDIDDYFQKIKDVCDERNIKIIDFGSVAESIRLLGRRLSPTGQTIEFSVFGDRYEVELGLIGDFQASNVLCALGLVLSEKPDDVDFREKAIATLSGLKNVRGRLELAATLPNGAAVYVDYAHTPDAVETVLSNTRPYTKNKLHVVVGCGGDRDKGKRSLMGKAAVEWADVVIITDDNPRTEDPTEIRRDVMQGAVGATEVADRREAIKQAMQGLGEGDVLVVAGKGHEQGQEINGEISPFDDAEVIRTIITEMFK